MKDKKEEVICFNIKNFEELYKKDPMYLVKIKRELVSIGAFPTRIDEPSKIFCVAISDKESSKVEVVKIFHKFGFKIKESD